MTIIVKFLHITSFDYSLNEIRGGHLANHLDGVHKTILLYELVLRSFTCDMECFPVNCCVVALLACVKCKKC